MFKLLGILFLGLIALLLAGVILFIRMLINLIHANTQKESAPRGPQRTTEAVNKSSRPRRKKLFSKDEGEYVDYEEVKD